MPDKAVPRQEREFTESAFFASPWSEETSKVRTWLLVTSVLGILMAAAGIFPHEIDALGLKVENINQRALLVVSAVVIAYLELTFLLYTYSDFLRGYWSELTKFEILNLPEDKSQRELVLAVSKRKDQLRSVHMFRLLLDALIPAVTGITAAVWLVWRTFHLGT